MHMFSTRKKLVRAEGLALFALALTYTIGILLLVAYFLGYV
jgi:hypothetical protein